MKEEKKVNMVLRTVYLPKDLDNKLRDFAFRKGRSKGDLMRELIQESLLRMKEPVLKKKDETASSRIQERDRKSEHTHVTARTAA